MRHITAYCSFVTDGRAGVWVPGGGRRAPLGQRPFNGTLDNLGAGVAHLAPLGDAATVDAARFMQVAERFSGQNYHADKFATVASLDRLTPTVLYALAAPSTPDEVVEEAVGHAAGGRRRGLRRWRAQCPKPGHCRGGDPASPLLRFPARRRSRRPSASWRGFEAARIEATFLQVRNFRSCLSDRHRAASPPGRAARAGSPRSRSVGSSRARGRPFGRGVLGSV